MRKLLLAAILLVVQAPSVSQFLLRNQFPHLLFSSPVGVYHPSDTTDRLFVVEQRGDIRVFDNDSSASAAPLFLDIHDSVLSGGELGLLGLAFHPNYAANGYFYVDYTRDNPLRTVISRFRVSASNPDSADRSSETVLVVQPQPFTNHNGGQLAFGPDGYLYIAFGDGGSGGDPLGNGQNRSTLLGKILRIDVDSAAGGLNYAIPPDNPFAGDTTKRGEIFAYGMRNPWRFSFDGQTLWCGDVGQNLWEEIDTITLGSNFGWNVMEGFHCYSPSSGCNQSGLTLPIWEYAHQSGRCSITGGFVYRGAALPALAGTYVYGDYCTGELWRLTPGDAAPPSNSFLLGAGSPISSFGVDAHGELYACMIGLGKIYKLWENPPGSFPLIAPPDGAANQPEFISCSWRPSAGAFAYEIQVALDSSFTSLVFSDSSVHDTVRVAGPLPDSTLLFWRVRASNGVGKSPYTPVRRFSTATSAVLFQLRASWNLISLPADAADPRRSVLFPSSISKLFTYDPRMGYGSGDELTPGPGYWLKFNDTTTVGVVGDARNTDTANVITGWNLIGSIATEIPAQTVESVPPGVVTSQFFGYDGSYFPSDTIKPGHAYWVRVSQTAQLILTSVVPATARARATAGATAAGAEHQVQETGAISEAGPIRIVPGPDMPPAPPRDDPAGSPVPIPSAFALEQNYPNPFNPATVIGYAIPLPGRVTLKVYNILGSEVATLVDRFQEAGYKSVTWDAGQFPGGIYLYRLTSGRFTASGKMALIR